MGQKEGRGEVVMLFLHTNKSQNRRPDVIVCEKWDSEVLIIGNLVFDDRNKKLTQEGKN